MRIAYICEIGFLLARNVCKSLDDCILYEIIWAEQIHIHDVAPYPYFVIKHAFTENKQNATNINPHIVSLSQPSTSILFVSFVVQRPPSLSSSRSSFLSSSSSSPLIQLVEPGQTGATLSQSRPAHARSANQGEADKGQSDIRGWMKKLGCT